MKHQTESEINKKKEIQEVLKFPIEMFWNLEVEVEVMANGYKPENITFHVILGSNVPPILGTIHHPNTRRTQRRCLTESTLRT